MKPASLDFPCTLDTIGRKGIAKVGAVAPHAYEALDLIREECNELGQAASKIMRCGADFKPSDGRSACNAKQDFTKEVVDVLILLAELKNQGMLDEEVLRTYPQEKLAKLRDWTHYQGCASPQQLIGALTDERTDDYRSP